MAGLALVVGGFSASAPARADADTLKVTATSGRSAQVSVTGCLPGSAGLTYRVADKNGKIVKPETTLVTFDAAPDFSFPVSLETPGTYTVFVTCLAYSGLGARTGSAQFTITGEGSKTRLEVSPTRWKSGDKVTLTATGMAPNTTATFAFGYAGHVTANEWTATVDASGKASVTVTWPGTNEGKPLEPGEYQVWVSEGPVVTLTLGANSQWMVGKPTGSTGGGGSLPSTGD